MLLKAPPFVQWMANTCKSKFFIASMRVLLIPNTKKKIVKTKIKQTLFELDN